EWARENSVPFASRAELIANPKVQALYEGIVEGINGNLARFEKLKRVLLVADEFTPDNGVLTPTMKLKRRVIEERYKKQIDEVYAQAEATAVPEAKVTPASLGLRSGQASPAVPWASRPRRCGFPAAGTAALQ